MHVMYNKNNQIAEKTKQNKTKQNKTKQTKNTLKVSNRS